MVLTEKKVIKKSLFLIENIHDNITERNLKSFIDGISCNSPKIGDVFYSNTINNIELWAIAIFIKGEIMIKDFSTGFLKKPEKIKEFDLKEPEYNIYELKEASYLNTEKNKLLNKDNFVDINYIQEIQNKITFIDRINNKIESAPSVGA